MSSEFDLIHNHHERAVFGAIAQRARERPQLTDQPGLLGDVACVALNRLPPRYIRHEVDFAFYVSEKERADTDAAIDEAVDFAIQFVLARDAMRARG